jgi:hypothetical protein
MDMCSNLRLTVGGYYLSITGIAMQGFCLENSTWHKHRERDLLKQYLLLEYYAMIHVRF